MCHRPNTSLKYTSAARVAAAVEWHPSMMENGSAMGIWLNTSVGG